MTARTEAAARAMFVQHYVEEEDSSPEWATGYWDKCCALPHKGDCPIAEHKGPITCDRCVIETWRTKATAILDAADAVSSGDAEVEALALRLSARTVVVGRVDAPDPDCIKAASLLRSLAAREAALREAIEKRVLMCRELALDRQQLITERDAAHSSGIAQGREEAADVCDEQFGPGSYIAAAIRALGDAT